MNKTFAKLFLFIATLLHANLTTADVVVAIEGGLVYDNNGVPLANGTLMYMIVAPDNNFAPLQPGEFVSGTNIFVGSWQTDDNVAVGGFSALLNFNLTGGLATGQPFGMIWFPNRSDTSLPGPMGGEAYGFYTHTDWILPPDGHTVSFGFETVSVGGSIPDAVGFANLTVIPEPSTAVLLLAGLGLALTRRGARNGGSWVKAG